MEDIMKIKQKTFELKQYASAILNDIDKRIAEERKDYQGAIDNVVNSKDKEIGKLNVNLLAKDSEIEKLKNENDKLITIIKNMKSIIGSALEICEGEE